MKIADDLSLATMQTFVLCPTLVVVPDESKVSGVNILTVSYVGVLSEKPPIVNISVRPKRYSHGLLVKAREFTLNIVLEKMLPDLDFCGTFSGRDRDKVTERKIELISSEKIKTPRIRKSPISLECKVRDILFLSREGASHDCFVSDVAAFHRDQEFSIEDNPGLATTNYSYREVGKVLGRAYQTWGKSRG
jgi:flavin reductase (DIM6/NTAB) family NADH-FMN oxidoreductase RutF